MVMLTAAGDTSGELSEVPASRRAEAGCGPNPKSATHGGGEVSAARVEVRPGAAGVVEIALRGELGYAAVLSCQLHHRLDLGGRWSIAGVDVEVAGGSSQHLGALTDPRATGPVPGHRGSV